MSNQLPGVDLTLPERATLAAMIRREARSVGYGTRYYVENRPQWPERLRHLERINEEAAERRMTLDTRVASALSGCTEGVVFPTKEMSRRAVRRLNTCVTHRGAHHFAVVDEGLGVVMSPGGRECLEKAGLL